MLGINLGAIHKRRFLKGDENRYLVLGKADVVFEVPKSFESR